MVNSKKVLAAISLISLSGCATEFKDYEGTAHRTALANICEQEGFISSSEFYNYSSFQMNGFPSQWIYDKQKLQQMYYDKVDLLKRYSYKDSRSREMLNLECGHIATVAERVRPK